MSRFLHTKEVNWKLPSKLGISHKHLNCLQLCVNEWLQQKGRKSLIEVFIIALNCELDGIKIKNEPSGFNRGIKLHKRHYSYDPALIKELMDKVGHCLIEFDSSYAQFSSYYNDISIPHWSMIFDYDDLSYDLLDDSGIATYFTYNKGTVPKKLIHDLMNPTSLKSISYVEMTKPTVSWEEEFHEIVLQSISNMESYGMNNLHWFFDHFGRNYSDYPSQKELDYVVYFFRKPREVLFLAWKNGLLPEQYQTESLGYILVQLTQAWGIVAGYVLKWGVSKVNNYNDKMKQYLQTCIQLEEKLLSYMKEAIK
ncbi:hypothetical protein [Chengkuizengella marina]|uniref:Butirosin biosynthesis protein H N-terminal domain-containing protein n=1 Tax=Chengkuizengella marina TaxID=2507566 RepID=A0A6N9Q5B8_9BACL|nr:hypothetical protein [Chengkuizengella marina]NBI29824.1 hypothetical protein [Chengkuizengella marina]